MSSANLASGIPVLRLSGNSNYDFEFVAEGAANFVFEIVENSENESSSIFKGNLLRVPKAGTNAHSYVELQQNWESTINPLFKPEDLVQQRLVKLDGEVVPRLNAVLAQSPAPRRADFKGSMVAEAEYGMLVEDMRQKHPDDLVLEFKPKWLAQSPSAPPTATRCRNCAREALKHHTKHPHHAGTTPQKKGTRPPLCPLNFLVCATSSDALATILTHFASVNPPVTPTDPSTLSVAVTSKATTLASTQSAQQTRLANWLKSNTLLPRLLTAQLANDTTGPLGFNPDAASQDTAQDTKNREHDPSALQLAMTLRDCTCFLRIPADPSLPVEAKLGDLDKKNWEAKLGYWREMERKLIEGGFYHGGGEGERWRTACVLEREGKTG